VSEDHRELLEGRAEDADERRRELGERTAIETPQCAREVLGPEPDDPLTCAEWEHAAGWAAAYRELAGHNDDADLLGAPPPTVLCAAR